MAVSLDDVSAPWSPSWVDSPAALSLLRAVHAGGRGDPSDVARLACVSRAFRDLWRAHGLEFGRFRVRPASPVRLAACVRHAVLQPGARGHMVAGVLAEDDGAVAVVDLRTGRWVATLMGHDGSVMDLAWSPDGSKIATACYDGAVRMWSPRTGRCTGTLQRFHTGWVLSVAWSSDGQWLAASSEDGWVRVWAVDGGSVHEEYERSALGGGKALCMGWSPLDGPVLAVGEAGGKVVVCDVAHRGAPGAVQVVDGHASEVQSLVWQGDGHGMVTAAWDGTVRVWKVHMLLEGQGRRTEVQCVRSISIGEGMGLRVAPSADGLLVAVERFNVGNIVTWFEENRDLRAVCVYATATGKRVASVPDDAGEEGGEGGGGGEFGLRLRDVDIELVAWEPAAPGEEGAGTLLVLVTPSADGVPGVMGVPSLCALEVALPVASPVPTT